jgi:hypothetical protein
MTLILGMLNIPNMIYFGSDDYSGDDSISPLLLQGSAVCTLTSWVSCNITEQWTDNMIRIANKTLEDGTTLVFALRNECDGAKIQLARINFISANTTVVVSFIHNSRLESIYWGFLGLGRGCKVYIINKSCSFLIIHC